MTQDFQISRSASQRDKVNLPIQMKLIKTIYNSFTACMPSEKATKAPKGNQQSNITACSPST